MVLAWSGELGEWMGSLGAAENIENLTVRRSIFSFFFESIDLARSRTSSDIRCGGSCATPELIDAQCSGSHL